MNMEENKMSTIAELAEVIAVQNAQIRELTIQVEEQRDIIVDYELNDEEEEKVTASFAQDFLDQIEVLPAEEAAPFQELFSRYFSGFEE